MAIRRIADWNDLPFTDNQCEYAFSDPPYDKRYDSGLRGIQRVTSKRLVILHHLVYPQKPILKDWKKIVIIGVTTGPNMRIRCLQIYEKL